MHRHTFGGWWRTLVFVVFAALVASACSSDPGESGASTVSPSVTKVDPFADLDLGGDVGDAVAPGIDSATDNSVPTTGQGLDSEDSLPDKILPPPTTAPPPTTEAPQAAPATTVAPITTPDGNTTRYVDGINGDDSADGTSVERAWRTLGRGIDALAPGTTVFVLDGNYDELRSPRQAHYVIRDKRGSADAWSRLLAYPGHRPKIVASSTSGIEILFSDFVEVSGFRIEGVGFGPDNTQGYGLLARDGHHFLFQDNVISGMGNSGIGGGENSSHFNIVNNVIHDNGLWSPDGSSGISLWRLNNVAGGDDADGYSNRILGNTLYRNENKVACSCANYSAITDGNGVIIDQSNLNGYAGRTLIANNTVFNNGARAINVHESSRVDIFSNTTYRNSFTAELSGERAEIAAYNANDVRIANNLLEPLEGISPIYVRGDASQANNVLVGGAPGADGPNWRVAFADFVNPSVDPAVADFRLNPTSPVYSFSINNADGTGDPVGAN